jgi:hypothetical protein
MWSRVAVGGPPPATEPAERACDAKRKPGSDPPDRPAPVHPSDGRLPGPASTQALRAESFALRTESVLNRAESVALRAESVSNRAESVALRTESVSNRAESVALRTESVSNRAESVALRAESVLNRAESVALRAESVLNRAESAALRTESASNRGESVGRRPSLDRRRRLGAPASAFRAQPLAEARARAAAVVAERPEQALLPLVGGPRRPARELLPAVGEPHRAAVPHPRAALDERRPLERRQQAGDVPRRPARAPRRPALRAPRVVQALTPARGAPERTEQAPRGGGRVVRRRQLGQDRLEAVRRDRGRERVELVHVPPRGRGHPGNPGDDSRRRS